MLKNFFIRQPKTDRRKKDPFLLRTGRLKDGILATVYRPGWAEDVHISDDREKETVGRSFNFSKITFLSLVLALFLSVILAKSAWLQVVKGEYYYWLSEGNRIRIERIEPRRGVIYDRYKNPLVRNKANFLLYFVPADMPETEELAGILKRIGAILENISERELADRLAEVDSESLAAYQPLFVADNIEYEKAMMLYLESANWPGVILSNRTSRNYLTYVSDNVQSAFSLSHIIGYTGKINERELEQFGDEYLPIDYIGKMGVEYFWENELKGVSGKKQIEVDALGKEKKVIGQEQPENGHNLVLSLDTGAQIKLENIMIEHLSKRKLSRASAIVMDPENGEVLAMVSLPAFDNNVFARGISQDEYNAIISHPDHPLFNRAVSGEYPSGSTIKPVMAAAALEEGIITEHTTFLSTGGIRIGEWFFPDWLAGGHGRVNVKLAIANSVNTFFYYIGGGHEDFKGLGLDRIIQYDKAFGLGAQTGIDLAGEADGFLPTQEWKKEVKNEPWYIGDTYHISIGQGDLLVTPLQVAAYTAVFANGGKLYRPHFVTHILTADEGLIAAIPVEPVRENFISGDNIDIVREGMRQTVTTGSARRLFSLPVTAAGKTGTAQWSSKNDPHAWFTGFAPFDDPKVVITVLLEEGKEGSETAVPIAEEFLRWYFGEREK
ncbi:MAG: penicillin-binding protein 2 [Candidatus Falkowbacteria bacterium]